MCLMSTFTADRSQTKNSAFHIIHMLIVKFKLHAKLIMFTLMLMNINDVLLPLIMINISK